VQLSEVSAVFILRASLMCLAPSSPSLFSERLRGPNKEQSRMSAPLLTTMQWYLACGGDVGAHLREMSAYFIL
jgi:hypothetical protein